LVVAGAEVIAEEEGRELAELRPRERPRASEAYVHLFRRAVDERAQGACMSALAETRGPSVVSPRACPALPRQARFELLPR